MIRFGDDASIILDGAITQCKAIELGITSSISHDLPDYTNIRQLRIVWFYFWSWQVRRSPGIAFNRGWQILSQWDYLNHDRTLRMILTTRARKRNWLIAGALPIQYPGTDHSEGSRNSAKMARAMREPQHLTFNRCFHLQ